MRFSSSLRRKQVNAGSAEPSTPMTVWRRRDQRGPPAGSSRAQRTTPSPAMTSIQPSVAETSTSAPGFTGESSLGRRIGRAVDDQHRALVIGEGARERRSRARGSAGRSPARADASRSRRPRDCARSRRSPVPILRPPLTPDAVRSGARALPGWRSADRTAWWLVRSEIGMYS